MTNTKLKKRLANDKLMLWGVCLLAALTAVPLFAILGEVFVRGYDQFSWSFFTEPTPTAYKAMKAIEAGEPIPGGIANGIIGTMIMLGMAVVVAVPLGILCGAFLAENSKSRFAQVVSYLTDLLQGTPSVIIGIITYIWVVVPMKGYSAIAGSVALCIMMVVTESWFPFGSLVNILCQAVIVLTTVYSGVEYFIQNWNCLWDK